MRLTDRITTALADHWLKGKEAAGIVIEAQRGKVTAKKLAAVQGLQRELQMNGTRVANGTKKLIDEFVARHDQSLNLDASPLDRLAKVFDNVNWYAKKTIGIRWLDALPAAVDAAMIEGMRAEGLEPIDWRDRASYFKLPIGKQYAYGAWLDDNSGFSIHVFSGRGRRVWETSGQHD